MKEIVFVTPQIKTGGGNRVFFELANILTEEYKIKIFYPNNSQEKHTFTVNEHIQFVAVGRLAKTKMGKLKNVILTFFSLNKYAKNSFVIITDPIMAIFGFLLRVKLRYRFIQADDYNIFNDRLIIQSKLLLEIYKYLTMLSYKYDYKFIFNSQYSYNQFCKYNLSFSGEPNIVHPAINHSIFNSLKIKELKKEKKQICLVARKHPLKGLHIFIEAWQSLSFSTKEKVSKVVLISHDDLSNFNTTDFEIVIPKSDLEIAAIFQESDIFISSSLSEGFGLPPLEAMGCGSAVIISRSGGVNEFAEPGFNCIMYSPESPSELAETIEYVLNNHDLIEKIQESGLKTVKRFDWKYSASALSNILRNSQ